MTCGLTQMVCVSDVIPQVLEPVYNVITYVPGVLNVTFNWLAAVGSHAPELFGWPLLKPKFSLAEIKVLGINSPLLVTGMFPEGPEIVQYFL